METVIIAGDYPNLTKIQQEITLFHFTSIITEA
jgi:hypothetical protein